MVMRSTDFRAIVEPILNEEFDGVYEQRKAYSVCHMALPLRMLRLPEPVVPNNRAV